MFKKIVGKIRKPKFNFAKLSSQDKVNHLSDKAIGLFDHMKKTYSELDDINNQLEQVIEEEDQKVIQIVRNREKAKEEIQMNKKVQEKLVDFIR
ncbi:hypothetical protein AAXB25_15010 [Paenibacillus lautus]|uniref:hypothetical protein n=1 Tax=Paenibacillus lautus TaxID=1401 RepID=UPI003D295168